MKTRFYRYLSLIIVLFYSSIVLPQENKDFNLVSLPKEISPKLLHQFHVQGIAVDLEKGYVYYSFTTSLLKTDLQGNPIGSVNGLTGHLGCLTFNSKEHRIYGSLEYKNDGIGKGILKGLNQSTNDKPSGFYIAIFDVDQITHMNMDAEKDGIMTTVYLPEVTKDYYGKIEMNGKEIEHIWGCSGIDGISFGPIPGSKKKDKYYLHVAYGIYNDTTRNDNNYQVILCYDTHNWKKYEQTLKEKELHRSGPKKPLHKFFLYTGNTTYGIQNLAYDKASNNWYAAVYPGTKKGFPNYTLFLIDGSQKSKKGFLKGAYTPIKGKILSLVESGEKDTKNGIYGWFFPYGSTGITSIGNGYFYISHNYSKDKKEGTTLYLYQWTGEKNEAFRMVK